MKTYLYIIVILYALFNCSCINKNKKQITQVDIKYIQPNSNDDFLLGKNICYYTLPDSNGFINVENEVIRVESIIEQKISIDDEFLTLKQDSISRYYLYGEKEFKINRILIDSLSSDFFNFNTIELSWDIATDIYKKDKFVLIRSSDIRWCGLASQYSFIQFFDLYNMICYEFFINNNLCQSIKIIK
ncbi:MAG: hypothetical protein WC984_08045 [Bacteroidales bacterium]